MQSKHAVSLRLLSQSGSRNFALLSHADDLKFSQEYIGILGSISSAGWIVGALVYRRYLKGITAKALLNLSIAATLAFLLLRSKALAAAINFFNGFASVIAFVATLSLAADYCPQRSEGFAFATLMSVTNDGATRGGLSRCFL